MLSIYITDNNGDKRLIDKVISVVLNSELDVPADDITITFPYDRRIIEDSDTITAYSGNKVVFTGKIDEIVNLCSSNQIVTKISARSLAGLLLDNEAEPVTYYCPAADFIFNHHLKQYGINDIDADGSPYVGLLKIDKGMTEWQVLESFCKYKYGTVPRVTGDGRALFRGCIGNQTVVFGDGGVDYRSLRENIKPCELISEVRVKLDEYGSYSSRVYNENPYSKNIMRVRYVNAASDTISLGTADTIISSGNAASYGITLECPGCYVNILGCAAEINDNTLGNITSLVVDKIKYTLGVEGEFTTVTLRKEI